MFNKIKAMVVENILRGTYTRTVPPPPNIEKFPFNRPQFLCLSETEIEESRNFAVRPVLIPRVAQNVPWCAGYAESINGGKSDCNEDQVAAWHMIIKAPHVAGNKKDKSPNTVPAGAAGSRDIMLQSIESEILTYYGMFDGHAGYGAAVMAANLLHKHLQEKLASLLELILLKLQTSDNSNQRDQLDLTGNFSVDDLVIGALESAFIAMDEQIEKERSAYLIKGGCTALVAILFLGKLYVANAGDCRAVLFTEGKVEQMSKEFTPESEKDRLKYLGYLKPNLLHDEFSCLEFCRRINKSDIGKQVLCKFPQTSGWSMKKVDEHDLKFPLVIGEGKKARLMGTIGVTRGFGDHDLRVFESDIRIKPFMTPIPEVKVLDLSVTTWTEDDVLVMGTDGLWDVLDNSFVADSVRKSLAKTKSDDPTRYCEAAQCLVNEAKGSFTGKDWKRHDDSVASFDDITVLVIPIKPYMDAYKAKQLWDSLAELNTYPMIVK
ncbi:hypothetical protein ACJMK2_017319 [Sinanodonta woodiana]|uniref:PPM-type phosphatase domain-containing protein n=1 Tax=Sinanodonta woodiana TaxID=1069815 RepID=A0ABD3UZU5_SINWO